MFADILNCSGLSIVKDISSMETQRFLNYLIDTTNADEVYSRTENANYILPTFVTIHKLSFGYVEQRQQALFTTEKFFTPISLNKSASCL